MKRLAAVLTVIFSLTAASVSAYAKTDVEVVVNGEILVSDAEAEIVDDRTFVPLRAIAEQMGAEVEWNQKTMGIKLKKDGIETDLAIGSLSATVTKNGSVSPAMLDAAPYIKDDRTFVPLRFIAQGLGSRVYWCDEIKTAVITENYSAAEGLYQKQVEDFFGRALPQTIVTDGELLGADIENNPESVMEYFTNLWTDKALELALESFSKAENEKFLSLASKPEEQYEYLTETAEKYGIYVECPIKMCSVKNNKNSALIIDAPAKRTADTATQCVLLSIDGKVSAVQI